MLCICLYCVKINVCFCCIWVSAGSGCVWIVYLGLCKKSGCRRLRVFSPRTGQLQEYCSIKCKNLDTTRPGTVLYTQPHLVTLQFVLNRKYWAFCIFVCVLGHGCVQWLLAMTSCQESVYEAPISLQDQRPLAIPSTQLCPVTAATRIYHYTHVHLKSWWNTT